MTVHFAIARNSNMKTTRLEAFSDGVLAIIITIMVLELKVPHGSELAALKPVLPVLLSYVLSFVYVGIYWNNHHHLFQATEQVSAGILWANFISCSGCRSSHSLRRGWVKITLLQSRPLFTASYC
jgi:uncharacterized membrane protein